MNPISLKEAESLFKKINKIISTKKVEIVLCVPSLYVVKLKSLSKKIALGIQNVFYENSGAYTGEISAEMAYSAGVRYVILGHSERRALGEDDKNISQKVKSALVSGLTPILCVGEKERDSEHEYLNFIQNQLLQSLEGISKNSLEKLIIAYEPIWAIGKDAVRKARGEEFNEMKIFIKKILSDRFGIKMIEKVRIIYGGSVNSKNVEEFLRQGDADGFLVGRDSLNPKKFFEIIKNIENNF